MKKGEKLWIGILVSLIFILGAVAAVSHSANEITIGSFASGEYTFSGLSGQGTAAEITGTDSGDVTKFGIMGKTTTTSTNSAAVYGQRVNTAWGALGYKDFLSRIYGVYGKHASGNYGALGGITWGGEFNGGVKLDYIQFHPQSSRPTGCSHSTRGTMYYSTDDKLWLCQGNAWITIYS